MKRRKTKKKTKHNTKKTKHNIYNTRKMYGGTPQTRVNIMKNFISNVRTPQTRVNIMKNFISNVSKLSHKFEKDLAKTHTDKHAPNEIIEYGHLINSIHGLHKVVHDHTALKFPPAPQEKKIEAKNAREKAGAKKAREKAEEIALANAKKLWPDEYKAALSSAAEAERQVPDRTMVQTASDKIIELFWGQKPPKYDIKHLQKAKKRTNQDNEATPFIQGINRTAAEKNAGNTNKSNIIYSGVGPMI